MSGKKKIGFFDLGTGRDPNKIGKERAPNKKIGCDACRLYKKCNSPKIDYTGEGKKKVLLISEYPGKSEDKRGTVWSKQAKKFLSGILDEIDIDLNKDCWSVHAVRCKPENEPNSVEIGYCRNKLRETISELNPSVIIPMGKIAIDGLIGDRISGRLSGTKLTAFYGEFIPDQELEKWICPTYSPEWLLRQTNRDKIDPVLLRIFKHSIKTAIKKRDGFYKHNLHKDIFTTVDVNEAIKWIKKALKSGKPHTFDYETTGIKPHHEDHELKTCSFSNGLHGYAFPYFDDNEEFVKYWKRFLLSKKVGKIAHNLPFENTWSKYKAGGEFVRNWYWDTCLAAHCINSHKPTGQKFWAYTYLGILNYDDSVDEYLKSNKEDSKKYGGNAFNNISKANLHDLLYYNAQDSKICYHIMEVQIKRLKGKFLKGYKMFQGGSEVLSQIQNEGLLVNMDSLNKNKRILTRKIDRAWNKIQQFPEFKKWPKGEFNPNSDSQLSRMLYDILGYKKPGRGESLTDKKQLTRLDTEFTKSLIPYRELLKMRDTYLAQFEREQCNGIIRPSFNLNIARTFRSSSSGPNFQNMPARDPNALKYVMSNLVPRPGNKLLEWDYKGVEVTVSASYHKDPNMIKYIEDESTDMHGDTAADCLMMKPKDVPKAERQMTKGRFVFSSFYGMGVDGIAPAMWEDMLPSSKKHLYNNGVRTYKDFYRHIEETYDIFWNKRFPVYKEWKLKIWKDYQKKGYVDLHTGFRYYGPVEFTQVTNAPIQGSAFHVLLWSIQRIYPEVKANFDRSHIIGQIHDAMVGDIHPGDENAIEQIVKYYGIEKVREHWDWLILPFKLEKESTEVDGSWNTMEGRGYI